MTKEYGKGEVSFFKIFYTGCLGCPHKSICVCNVRHFVPDFSPDQYLLTSSARHFPFVGLYVALSLLHAANSKYVRYNFFFFYSEA